MKCPRRGWPYQPVCSSTSKGAQAPTPTLTPTISSCFLVPLTAVCLTDEVSSLRVGIPAWVEFFHRESRQGLLAFVVAVHATLPPLPSSPSTTTKTATDSRNIDATTAETVDDNVSSPARATRSAPSWTCLRTGKELSRAVEAYRESDGPSTISASWQSKPRPRVFQHMGRADQVGLGAFRVL